jgi:hypothetical protein
MHGRYETFEKNFGWKSDRKKPFKWPRNKQDDNATMGLKGLKRGRAGNLLNR